jgi:microcystin-dependent protein
MPLKNGKTTASLQTTLVGSVIPPGTIAPFGGGTVPAGWLLCDGTAISRTTYSALFSAVGIVHGQGDGSSTFHLPDYRGRFLRGADDMGTGAAGRDPGDNRTAANAGGNSTGIGSVQADAMQGHWHNYRANVAVNLTGGDENSTVITETTSTINTTDSLIRDAVTNGSNGIPRLASESRPQNANTTYIIKV